MVRTAGFVGFMVLAVVPPARADDPSVSIVLKNNQFVPSEVQIPAGVKVKLVVRNDNPTPSEFSIRAAMSFSTISTRRPVAIWWSNSGG
jgi:hypothetical protein